MIVGSVTFQDTMDGVARGVETVGVAILVIGGLIALGRAAVGLARDRDGTLTYRKLRSYLGRTILLGLEVLVVADLIRTIAVDPSLENVGVLGLIVLIRTFLSFSLDIEIDGRVPWRAAANPPPSPS